MVRVIMVLGEVGVVGIVGVIEVARYKWIAAEGVWYIRILGGYKAVWQFGSRESRGGGKGKISSIVTSNVE